MCSVIGIRHDDRGLMGGSYDFHYHHGLIVSNRRGLHKQALEQNQPVLEWESRYGSVTLDQFGRELPSCGINEAGLAIHMAQQPGKNYPPVPEGQPKLTELQWIQYQLDRHGDVDEVIAALDEAPIEPAYMELHYALCDSNGDMAIIEYVAGERRVIRNPHSHGLVMTNHPVSEELNSRDRSGQVDAPRDSTRRFEELWQQLDDLAKGMMSERSLQSGLPDDAGLNHLAHSLELVRRRFSYWTLMKWLLLRIPPFYTCWNTLFDCTGKRLFVRGLRRASWHQVSVSKLDLAPNAPALGMDLERMIDADLTRKLKPLRREDNARIIRASYRPLGKLISEQEIEALIDYPDLFQSHT